MATQKESGKDDGPVMDQRQVLSDSLNRAVLAVADAEQNLRRARAAERGFRKALAQLEPTL